LAVSKASMISLSDFSEIISSYFNLKGGYYRGINKKFIYI